MAPDDLTRTRYGALAELVRDPDRSGRWLVLTHDNPDPDAIASAAILGKILRNGFQQKVTLAYGGIVGRSENRELVRILGVKFSHVRHLNLKVYQRFALVDAQPFTGNNQLPEGVLPDLVFDHHPERLPVEDVPFADIRPAYGATATILAEYLDVSGLPLPRSLATAVVYAIRSETQEFGREYSKADKAVYDRLLTETDRRALARIQNARLPLSYFRNLHEALENMETVDTLVVSHLGRVEQPDIVPEIADLFLRMEGKTWSLCHRAVRGAHLPLDPDHQPAGGRRRPDAAPDRAPGQGRRPRHDRRRMDADGPGAGRRSGGAPAGARAAPGAAAAQEAGEDHPHRAAGAEARPRPAMRRSLVAGPLLVGLVLASWGLTVAVPALARAEPGYLTRDLYLVLAWAGIWIACAVGLVRLARRR